MQLIFRLFWRKCGAMARKLRLEYCGVIYHVQNRGDPRESFRRHFWVVAFALTMANAIPTVAAACSGCDNTIRE